MSPIAHMPPRPAPIRRARQTVVLLHSSAASARQWDALAERLQPHFDVQAIDLHGHGRQPVLPGERALTLRDDAELVLPVIERAGGAHLIGHSYGGAVALYLAAARPPLVRSLAVYEPVLFRLLLDLEPQGAAARESIERGELMRTLVATGQAEAAAQRFVDYWSGRPTWAGIAPERQRSLAARMPVVVQHFDTLHREPMPLERLLRLTMPVLCLAGARSTAVALRVASLLRAVLPGACHELLPGLGHMAPITDADGVNERLLRFLGVQTPCVAERAAA